MDIKFITKSVTVTRGLPEQVERIQELEAEIERLREALECVVAYWNEWRDAPDNHATALSLEEVVNIVCAALKEKE